MKHAEDSAAKSRPAPGAGSPAQARPAAEARAATKERLGRLRNVPGLSVLTAIATVLPHLFRRRDTLLFPEEAPPLPPRYRGRIVLTRDPSGGERCVACYLCAVACPVDCIALQATEDENGRRYPEWFRINFSRCIFCGFCEEACPTKAIQLTPDFDMNEYRRANMVYEKEHLLISGPGKYHEYDFYRVAGVAIGGKDKGEAENEAAPIDLRRLLP